jgi:hypothetical protein
MKKTMANVCWLAKAKFSPSLFLFLSLFFVCFFTVSLVFFSTSSFPWFFTRFLLFRYVFCVFRSGNRVRSPDLFSLNCILRGLKPENVMRSPSNMKRTLRTVTVVMETHRDLVCWRRWVSFETAPFCSLTDMANFNCPPEVLTFCDWTLIHGKSPSHFFNFAPG